MGTTEIKVGDWVRVKPEHDIAPVFRGGQPTEGRVAVIEDGLVEIWIPIGGADVDEHSQAVPYSPAALELTTPPGDGEREA
jgi:hypothetical protein